jgi:hypothetical protein
VLDTLSTAYRLLLIIIVYSVILDTLSTRHHYSVLLNRLYYIRKFVLLIGSISHELRGFSRFILNDSERLHGEL